MKRVLPEPAGQLSGSEAQRLAEDPQWQSSRFGELEDFIFDFLVGGRGDGGEAVRLKLQTPLFVADALLEAAGQQLAAELQTAEEVSDFTFSNFSAALVFLALYVAVAHMEAAGQQLAAELQTAEEVRGHVCLRRDVGVFCSCIVDGYHVRWRYSGWQ